MTLSPSTIISKELNINESYIEKTIKLIQDGGTVPFIARYRKEATGNMDEVNIGFIKTRLNELLAIEKRKQTILKAIDDQGKLNTTLKDAIAGTYDTHLLEDLYLPYKQKRNSRAEKARIAGLEPLAKIIMAQRESDITARARHMIKGEIKNLEQALSGATDIMAEWINENQRARDLIRNQFNRYAVISAKVVKGKEEEGQKFKDYFDFNEPLNRCRSHRLLALRRGESLGFLKVKILSDEAVCLQKLERLFIKNDPSGLIKKAIKEAYKRFIAPAMATEFGGISKQKADEDAIAVFAENLNQLLLGAPLGEQRILAIDPGFKSGCKLVCLDEKGDLLHNENIYPHPPQGQHKQAIQKISTLTEQYKIQAIAIGNGTAGRETENLIQRIRFKNAVQVFVVNEAGASIYSASSVARAEFPNYDVTVRGAVSIGRRLMDPLAELVKIDPKSIGVGQYQHDVDQKTLKDALDTVVEACVNKVGVDVNTASQLLLQYVAGLGPQLAQNMVDYRKANGGFRNRKDFLNVPRMGQKAFEQCSGFLRIKNGDNPLDNSGVHPERYATVKAMARQKGLSVDELIRNEEVLETLDWKGFVSDDLGMATLEDIKCELLRPGLDPRKKAKAFSFDKSVKQMKDLKIGMVLPGLVSNITNFGAFVDIGVKQDGLVHISMLADEYISNPADYVSLNQQVSVRVLEVDMDRKRIALSMKDV